MLPLLLLLFFWNGAVSSFRNALIHRVPPWNRRAASTTIALRLSTKESLQFIVLGGTGDLSISKILPSLFDLYAREYHDSELTDSMSFLVQLVARSDWSTSTLHAMLMNRLTLPSDSTHSQFDDMKTAFVQRCSYVRVSSYHSAALADAVLLSHPTVGSITSTLPAADTDAVSKNTSTDTDTNTDIEAYVGRRAPRHHRRIVYFSLPPTQYLPVLQALHHHPPVKSDRAADESLLELVLEKPVGADRASARVTLQVL